MRTLFLLFLVVSCGSENDNSRCVTREESNLRCQAEELAKLDEPTQWEINLIKENCSRKHVLDKCY
jgi:hypothetical protein